VRPTFEPSEELLEANLFGFDGDLYGRMIEIALHAYIRPERKFDDLSELAAQMQEDAAEARKLLALPE
jgi:riboflavin kinase/FMN adenylyltransferase